MLRVRFEKGKLDFKKLESLLTKFRVKAHNSTGQKMKETSCSSFYLFHERFRQQTKTLYVEGNGFI